MATVQWRVQRSQEMFDRARRVIAGGVSTAFRGSERPVPLFFESGAGGRLRDIDGNEYVDFVCGYGPIILGHANPGVLDAAAAAAASYQQVGGQNPLEVELA